MKKKVPKKSKKGKLVPLPEPNRERIYRRALFEYWKATREEGVTIKMVKDRVDRQMKVLNKPLMVQAQSLNSEPPRTHDIHAAFSGKS